MKGLVSWFEIPAVDLERAVSFYQKMLNAEIEVVDLMGVKYGILPRVGEVTGAIVKREGLQPGKGVSLYFYVTDINTTLERIDAAGGKVILGKTLLTLENADGTLVVSKTLIDNQMGYFAQFYDTEGNLMALHSNS